MEWNTDIGYWAKMWMKFLGDFSPTAREEKRELKGYMYDDEGGGKVYLDAGELRELAAACNEVASWLDRRAESVPNVEVRGAPEMTDEQNRIDAVCLSESKTVREALENMLTAAIGEHGYFLACVDLSVALLVIEAAKRAEDRDEWFPRGKWATVQAMQDVTESELRKMFDGA